MIEPVDPLRQAQASLKNAEDLLQYALAVCAELVVNAARDAPDESMSPVERRKYVRKLSLELLGLLPLILRALTEVNSRVHLAQRTRR